MDVLKNVKVNVALILKCLFNILRHAASDITRDFLFAMMHVSIIVQC